jgi:alpha-tubulin suppressor-like RCC1 family protein
VTTEERAYCWGWNFDGELGDGTGYPTNYRRLTPVLVAGGRRFSQVRAGHDHTCALTPYGVAFCWGYNVLGQLGDNSTLTRFSPVRVMGGLLFSQLDLGDSHTCGVTRDQRAYCWGANFFGKLGDGGANTHAVPVKVTGGHLFRQVTAGGQHTCGITPDNLAYCWGFNNDGELGDGRAYPAELQHLTPVAVTGGLHFDHLSAGYDHTCGVTPRDRAYCWGRNASGQLGDGTTTGRVVPTAVAGGLLFSGIWASNNRTCALTPADQPYCWGNSRFLTPVVVPGTN